LDVQEYKENRLKPVPLALDSRKRKLRRSVEWDTPGGNAFRSEEESAKIETRGSPERFV
jgi:hypothetical protein